MILNLLPYYTINIFVKNRLLLNEVKIEMSQKTSQSKFELLRVKSILAILDGDTDFGNLEIDGEESDIKISMPYLSGPMLCDLSTRFGLPATYGWNGGAQSRWAYLDDLLEYAIQNGRESDLLAAFFSKVG